MDTPIKTTQSIPMRRITPANTTAGSSTEAGPSGTSATQLPPGGGPVSGPLQKKIDNISAQPLSGASQRTSTQQGAPAGDPAPLAAQRTAFLAARAPGASTRPIDLLTQQFRLEGEAVRSRMSVAQDVTRLADGTLTQAAVALELPASHAASQAWSGVYAAVNAHGPGDIHPPFAVSDLEQAGIGANDAERRDEQKLLTHDAYVAVLAKMEGDGADPHDIENVKLAHEAFKIHLAQHENGLEDRVIDLQVRDEAASNKLLMVTSEADRTKAKAEIKPQLDAAKKALADHGKVSNHVLHAERVADHERRAITSKDGWSWIPKVTKQALAVGGTQIGMSWATWGYLRNLGAMAADARYQGQTGAAPFVASVAIEALVLATSHKLLSDGPREVLNAAMEFGGWARPPEASNAKQLFPDARRSTLDNNGEPVVLIDHADRQKTVDDLRSEFARKSPKFEFGNVDGDNAGQGAFGTAQMLRDAAGLDSIHAIAGASALGGGAMSTAQGVGKLNHQVLGFPTYVAAKRPNPRGVAQRFLTGAQKLDLTQAANRQEFLTKFAHAAIGIAAARGLNEVGSIPVEEAIATMDDKIKKGGLEAAHAILEFLKPFATLSPFFSGLSVTGDAKTVPGNLTDEEKRMVVGMHELSNPYRTGSEGVYEPGTVGHHRQAVNTFSKGVAQAAAQIPVVWTDQALSGAANAVAGLFRASSPENDDVEQQRQPATT